MHFSCFWMMINISFVDRPTSRIQYLWNKKTLWAGVDVLLGSARRIRPLCVCKTSAESHSTQIVRGIEILKFYFIWSLLAVGTWRNWNIHIYSSLSNSENCQFKLSSRVIAFSWPSHLIIRLSRQSGVRYWTWSENEKKKKEEFEFPDLPLRATIDQPSHWSYRLTLLCSSETVSWDSVRHIRKRAGETWKTSLMENHYLPEWLDEEK